MGYPLDPYRILEGLERQGVDYILVGSLARVLVGAERCRAGSTSSSRRAPALPPTTR
jgi:hypothetical protein